ncbi:MAG TPA: metal-dependent hydrolase [Pirellulales bacterium]|nr:metal-dependent hydrolase [Pirellulales bacterium]
MAGFKTHITTSTILGIGYGTAAYFKFNVPWDTAALAGGLCSVSGMLPDIDSGPGVPLRESLSFAAAVVPMLMIDRFTKMGMSFESMALAGGFIYCLIRFGLGRFLRKYTVHRGMFHSIPACLIFGELAFLICHSDNLYLRYFKAGGVVLGFMSHLLLDEIWSIEFNHGIPHLKSSFGTAMKFWGKSMSANFSCYAKLAVLTFLVLQDPIWMGRFDTPLGDKVESVANGVFQRLDR